MQPVGGVLERQTVRLLEHASNVLATEPTQHARNDPWVRYRDQPSASSRVTPGRCITKETAERLDGVTPFFAPVGFRAIRLQFALGSDADEQQLATLLKLTERYCVVLQTIASGVKPTATIETNA